MAPARIAARRVLAGVLALGALIPFFGLVDLGTIVGLADPSEQWPVPLEASWGCLFTFIVGGAYAWLAIARAPRFAVLQLAVAAGALAVGSLAGGDAGPLPVALAVAASVVLLCLIDPGVVPRPPLEWRSPRWPHLVLAAAGAAIWLPYVLSASAASRAGAEGDVTNGIEHWPVQGASGVALITLGFALAMAGRTLPARLAVAASASIVGVAALAYPDRAGATEGPLWAGVAILWGVAITAVAAWGLRRPEPDRGSARRDGTLHAAP